MKAIKRTILVGACMFALISGVSAQTSSFQDFEAYQAKWKQSHNVTEMTPALYERMKMSGCKPPPGKPMNARVERNLKRERP